VSEAVQKSCRWWRSFSDMTERVRDVEKSSLPRNPQDYWSKESSGREHVGGSAIH